MSRGKVSPIIEEKPKKKPRRAGKKVKPLTPVRRMRLTMPDKISQTYSGLLLEWQEKVGSKMIYTEIELKTLYVAECTRMEVDVDKERKTAHWSLRLSK